MIDGVTSRSIAVIPGLSQTGDLDLIHSSNKLYMIQNNTANVAYYDLTTHALLGTLPISAEYGAVAANPSTNRVYVAQALSDQVTVIDSASNSIIGTIAVGDDPKKIGINSTTNRIYVPNAGSGTVSVIDGNTNTIIGTISVGSGPIAVAVNALSNRVYVANYSGQSVSIVDGATNTVIDNVALGGNAFRLALLPEIHRVFVASDDAHGIFVFDDDPSGPIRTFTPTISPTPSRTPTFTPSPTATVVPGLCTAIASDLASKGITWNCGHVPLPGESILIPAGISVPFDVDLVDLQHVTIASGGTLKGVGVPHTLSLTGNFSNSGVLNPNGAMTVRFKGTGAQTLDGTGTSFFDLVIENNGGGVTFNSPATVLGTLNLRSDLTIAAPNLLQQEGASTGNGDVIGSVRHRVAGPNIPVSFGNPSVLLTFANQGTLPQDVTITLSKNAPGGLSTAVSRVYGISANGGSGYAATLQLHYTDAEVASAGASENSLQLFRYTGSTWSAQGGTVNAASDYVSLTGITQFSNWAISSGAPTAAALVDFTVEPKGKVVKVRWVTGSELNLIGFDVWRKVGKREWKKLNKQLIPAKNLGRVSGTSYVFNDVKVRPKRTYRYRLELINGNGENEISYEVKIRLP